MLKLVFLPFLVGRSVFLEFLSDIVVLPVHLFPGGRQHREHQRHTLLVRVLDKLFHPLHKRRVDIDPVKQPPRTTRPVVEVKPGFVGLGGLYLQEHRVGVRLLQFQTGRFGANVVEFHPQHTLSWVTLGTPFTRRPLHPTQFADVLQGVVGDQAFFDGIPTLDDAALQPTTHLVHTNVFRP